MRTKQTKLPTLAACICLALAGCGEGTPVVEPDPVAHLQQRYIRFQVSGDPAVGAGKFEAASSDMAMNTASYNGVLTWYVGGSSYPSMTGFAHDEIEIVFNPHVTEPGTYRPGDCPERAGLGCFQTTIILGAQRSSSSGLTAAVGIILMDRDSSTLVVKEIGEDYARAEFFGTGLLHRRRPDQSVERVRVEISKGAFLAWRFRR